MDKDKQIIVGLLVLAGLGGAGYWAIKKDQQVGTTTTTASAELPSVKGPEDPDKIELTTEKGKVVLEKKGETWELIEPIKFPAHAANVKSLIDNLKELKASEVITPTVTDALKKSYELEGGKAIRVAVSKGGEKQLDITFGKSGGRGQLALLDGRNEVLAVSGFSSYLYSREIKGWRDTQVFKFDEANAISLAIENDNGKFSFTKGDKWAGTFAKRGGAAAPIANFEESKVGEALRAFKSLSADDFGDDKSLADTGLDKASSVTITLKDGAGTYKLLVGNTSSGNSRYAKKEDSDVIYTISSWPSEWVTAELKKFQKSDDKAGSKDSADDGHGHDDGPPGLPPGFQLPPGMGGMGGMDDE